MVAEPVTERLSTGEDDQDDRRAKPASFSVREHLKIFDGLTVGRAVPAVQDWNLDARHPGA